MALTKEDLKSIKEIVVGVVDKKIDDFAISVAKGFEEVNLKIGSVRSELKSEVGSLRSEMHLGFKKADEKIEAEVGSLRSEMHFEFRKVHDEIGDVKEEVSAVNKRVLMIEDSLGGDMLNLKTKMKLVEKKLAV